MRHKRQYLHQDQAGVDSIVGARLIALVNVVVGYLVFCRTRPRWAYWV